MEWVRDERLVSAVGRAWAQRPDLTVAGAYQLWADAAARDQAQYEALLLEGAELAGGFPAILGWLRRRQADQLQMDREIAENPPCARSLALMERAVVGQKSSRP